MIHEPKLTDDQKRQLIARHREIVNGMGISCGHDDWVREKAKDAPNGDIFLCTRCWQYLAKLPDLPWWIDGDDPKTEKYPSPPRSAHLEDRRGYWLQPIHVRLQDRHGNTITKP